MQGKKLSYSASPARLAALEVCGIIRTRKAFASEIIGAQIDSSDMIPADKAFATLLVLGVVSTQGTLDEIIDRSVHSSKNLEGRVRDSLRISCYEIIFLGKSPYAAVDQGVALVRSVTHKAAGLANAVLRKIVADKETFPFGNPETDFEALSRLHAFPFWMTNLLVNELGFAAAKSFLEASNSPAPLFIAVNSLKATSKEVQAVFREAGSEVAKVSLNKEAMAECFYVKDGKSLQAAGVKNLFAEGKILVSDAAAQLVVESILPEKAPASFLEVGAGRGTKSILIQSAARRRYGEQIPLQVLDFHGFKIKILKDRLAVYDARLDKTHVIDARKLDKTFKPKSFEMVFIDAACSGLGTLRRHPEIRWRLQKESISTMAKISYEILEETAKLVKVGGTLAYSTCTVTREENQGVIETFLKSERGKNFRLEPIAGKASLSTQLRPGSSDAHFAVRMVRVG